MSIQVNAVLDAYHATFSMFAENHKNFKEKLIDKLTADNHEFMTKAFEFIDGIEKNYDLLYDAASNIYMFERNYSGLAYSDGESLTFTGANLKALADEGRTKLYIPFLKNLWEFAASLRGNVVNGFKYHHQCQTGFSGIFEAIRGIEKNILEFLKLVAEVK